MEHMNIHNSPNVSNFKPALRMHEILKCAFFKVIEL